MRGCFFSECADAVPRNFVGCWRQHWQRTVDLSNLVVVVVVAALNEGGGENELERVDQINNSGTATPGRGRNAYSKGYCFGTHVCEPGPDGFREG